ncbi:LPXTG cell wall anchor domain-containing protein [Hutsoniella sourekii]|uniref:LPXTG cell wall anchor domain-containing protein n=1 Tax=Hutsoniella sourekii TaxID=87650 RepID=UPI0004837349|nr:LPXTG cell wall anchor domain-containing protein [Hutsoniella sourekii]
MKKIVYKYALLLASSSLLLSAGLNLPLASDLVQAQDSTTPLFNTREEAQAYQNQARANDQVKSAIIQENEEGKYLVYVEYKPAENWDSSQGWQEVPNSSQASSELTVNPDEALASIEATSTPVESVTDLEALASDNINISESSQPLPNEESEVTASSAPASSADESHQDESQPEVMASASEEILESQPASKEDQAQPADESQLSPEVVESASPESSSSQESSPTSQESSKPATSTSRPEVAASQSTSDKEQSDESHSQTSSLPEVTSSQPGHTETPHSSNPASTSPTPASVPANQGIQIIASSDIKVTSLITPGATHISGLAPAGSTVTVEVTDPQASLANNQVLAATSYVTQADANGQFHVQVEPLKAGQIVTITAAGQRVQLQVAGSQTTSQASNPAVSAQAKGYLPETGEASNYLIFAAAAVILLGAGLLIMSRRGRK